MKEDTTQNGHKIIAPHEISKIKSKLRPKSGTAIKKYFCRRYCCLILRALFAPRAVNMIIFNIDTKAENAILAFFESRNKFVVLLVRFACARKS